MRVKFFFKDSKDDFSIWLLPWYCRPVILRSLCYHLNEDPIFSEKSKCLFCTCDKFGCRQFLPKESRTFYVLSLVKENIAGYDVYYCVFD